MIIGLDWCLTDLSPGYGNMAYFCLEVRRHRHREKKQIRRGWSVSLFLFRNAESDRRKSEQM